jgi:alkylmercury lyase
MATVPTTDQLVEALTSAARPLDAADQRLAITLYRALADGEPVPAAELARRTGRNLQDVKATLHAWPGVFHDDQGRIIGFWGLALPAMAHRLQIGGRTVHAWCAFDPLFITPLLGQPTQVASRCPATGEPVSLTVTPDGVKDLSPAGTVVSLLAPTRPWDHHVIESFCHYVLYFASQAAGRQWVARHPGTFLLPIAQAFELGRRYALVRFGAALADAA